MVFTMPELMNRQELPPGGEDARDVQYENLCRRLHRAESKLQAIREYAQNLGKATGDWSVASPVLEIIDGDY